MGKKKEIIDEGAAVLLSEIKPLSKFISVPRELIEVARRVGAHLIEDRPYIVVKLRSKEACNTNYPDKLVIGQGFLRFFGSDDEIAIGIHIGKSWFRTSAIKLGVRAENIYIVETQNSVYRLERPPQFGK